MYWSFALFLFLSFNGTYVSFLKKYIFLFFYSLIGCCNFGIAYGISIQKYHVVLENGQKCGDLDIQHTAQYQMDVHYMCSENGRGDDFREKIQFNPSNIITHYEMNGTTEMGARVFERYSLEKNMAIWRSSSDHGKLHVDGKSFYFPTNASYAVHALLIQALEKTQKKELNLLPLGKVQSTVVDTVVLSNETGSFELQLLMVTGLGLNPDFFWVSNGLRRDFFIFIAQGYAIFPPEMSSSIPFLKDRQNQVLDDVLTYRAKTLQHRINGSLLIKNVFIFDSQHATRFGPQNVYIQDGRIAQITDPLDSYDSSEQIIDGTGSTLLPGLFDMHAHLTYWSGALHLANGVTTIRDMGNVNHHLQKMMRLQKQGALLAPTIIPSGLIEGKSAYSNTDGILIESLQDAKDAVDYYESHGYQHIKIYSSFPKEYLNEISQYAHQKGLTVGGHIPAFMTASEAVLSGFDEVTHMNQLLLQFVSTPTTDSRTLERFYLPAEKFSSLDFHNSDFTQLIALLKEKHVTVDPTLAGFDFLKQQNGTVAKPYESIIDHMPPLIQRDLKSGALNIQDKKTALRYEKSYEKMIEFTARLYREGIPIVAGTDAFAGFTLLSELELYVKAGLTPSEALQIATYGAAVRTQTFANKGSIEVGKDADLILVKGDPTASLSHLREISLVVSRGFVMIPNEIFSVLHIQPFFTGHCCERITH